MKMQGRKICTGTAEGEIIATKDGISFYGGIDPKTGIVLEKGHELEGKSVAGKILVFPQGKGSTVGSYVLYNLKKNGKAPLAIVNKECETIVAVGCIISEIPCIDRIEIEKLQTGMKAKLNAEQGTLETE